MYQLKKKASVLTLLILAFTFIIKGQGAVDTFQTHLDKEKNDSAKMMMATRIAKYYENIDTVASWKYFEIAKKLAGKLNTITAKIATLELEGVLYTKSNPAKAYLLYKEAIELCESNKQQASLNRYRASLTNNLGVISYLNGDYEGAAISFRQAVIIYEKYYPTEPNLIPTINNIASAYNGMGFPEKAIMYNHEALEYAMKYGNDKQKTTAYIGYGSGLLSLKKYDAAFVMINNAQVLTNKTNNQYDQYLCYFNFGEYYSQKGDADSAIYFFKLALPLAKAINSPYDIAQVLNYIANQEMDDHKKELDSAKRHLDSSRVIFEKYGFREIKKEWYQLMAEYCRINGNTKEGFEHLKKYDLIKDSLQNETNLKRVDFLEARYESEKKQTSITNLEEEKKIQQLSLQQKSTINYFLMGTLAILIITGIIGYRNLRHRQQISRQQNVIHQQRISELEKDKQLIAVDCILKGQEVERSRMAKDLHDGLGGLLSGVKFSLSNMKDNLIITPDNMAVFERSLDLIDTSIKELRRVAQNMMPEMLIKFGLDEALKDYCNTINATKLLEIKYQSIGMETRIESSSEIIIYRIIQELLNNIMKHAVASEARVQLIKEENRFNIIVEDNGKGYDTTLMKANTGAGLTNVQSRVDYLKGQLEIHSEMGKGTLINIEFNI
jgi:two-component system NarL family sensor kinase